MSILLQILHRDLTKIDIFNLINLDELTKIIESIEPKRLYKSHFHGLYHSEKVTFFAYLISKSIGLNEVDEEILFDATRYHDIGRTNDCEDTTHGLTSTLRLSFLEEKPIYQDPTNLKLLKAIIEGHSLDDNRKKLIFDIHDLEEQEYERYEQLYNILKDADALDRLRFNTMMKCVLDANFLRLSISKKLIDTADYINKKYREYISNRQKEKTEELFINNEPQIFYHSIGYNFLAIPSILKRGIISSYYDEEEKFHLKEYTGNNNLRWISALSKKGKAYEFFAKDKINFKFKSAKYYSGIGQKCEAQDLGLPYQSGLYDDEVFIYDKVDPEDILSLIVSKNLYYRDFREINLLNGNISSEKVQNRVYYYLGFIFQMTYKDYQDEFKDDLYALYINTVKFENKDTDTQKETSRQFFEEQEKTIKEINQKLLSIIYNILKSKLNKEEILMKDVIDFILTIKDINYEIKEEEEIISYSFGAKIRELKLSHQ